MNNRGGNNKGLFYLVSALLVLLVLMAATVFAISETLAASNGPTSAYVPATVFGPFGPNGGTGTPIVTATPCGPLTFVGSLTASDPTAPGRLQRDSASVCGTPNICPGPNDTAPRRYDTYTFVNGAAQSRCITVNFTGECTGTHLTSEAYLEFFDPQYICLGWIAQSATFGTTGSYSFDIPPGARFTIVMMEVTANSGGCPTYTLTVSGLDSACYTPTPSATATITNTPLPTNTRTQTSTPLPTNTWTQTYTPMPTNTFTPTSTNTPIPNCGPNGNYTANISTNATIVPGTTDIGNHTDDGTTLVTLPFTFNFYGTDFNTANVSSNGSLQFLSDSVEPLNGCLPASSLNYAMLPYWDDLRTDILTGTVPSGIFTSVEGTPGSRIFNIEWRAAYRSADDQMVNFAIRLYENAGPGNLGRFDYVYGSAPFGGSSATIGAQKMNGANNFFIEYACSQSGSVPPGLQVSFTLPTCATPTPACTPYAVGHLVWQTIPQPNARNAQPLTVTIKSGVAEMNATVSADASGFFTVPLGSSFPTGNTNWRVKGPRHLANCGVLTVISCGPSSFEAGTLRGGDANPTTSGNNLINANDFTTLKTIFGQSCPSGCSSDTDFNNIVNASDFTVLKGNFGQAGCGPVLRPESIR